MRGVALVGLAAAVSACASQPVVEEIPPEDGELRFLTYNVHGLPDFVTGDDTATRMLGISPLLAAYEVAALQENFFHSAELMTDVEHPHAAHFHDIAEGRTTHSGLTLLSRAPIEESEGEAWRMCHGLADGASDCLATKGLQWSRLRLGAGPHAVVDVFNLHVEAGGGEEDVAARTSDIDQLLENISTRSAGRALVVLGDFNLRPSDSEDAPLLDKLEADAELREVCGEVGCPEADHIDRIYVRDGERVSLTPVDWRREQSFVDEGGTDLSDHPAVSALIGWSAR